MFEAMTALGLGAAVLRRDGSMLACNTAFEKILPDWPNSTFATGCARMIRRCTRASCNG